MRSDARAILGVGTRASFDEIRRAFLSHAEILRPENSEKTKLQYFLAFQSTKFAYQQLLETHGIKEDPALTKYSNEWQNHVRRHDHSSISTSSPRLRDKCSMASCLTPCTKSRRKLNLGTQCHYTDDRLLQKIQGHRRHTTRARTYGTLSRSVKTQRLAKAVMFGIVAVSSWNFVHY